MRGKTKKFLWENSLSLVLFCLFFLTLVIGESVAGWFEYNQTSNEHSKTAVTYREYIVSSHFLEATMENWESEFLQIFVYIALTSILVQKGSAESKRPEESSTGHTTEPKSDSPWPVRKGGWILKVYENSLTLAFLLLFLFTFCMHAYSGAQEYSEDQLDHGGAPVSMLQFVATSRFWFESFQNWQSEFLAIWAMVVLSIFLRQKGSPESKQVEAPHSATGKE